MAGLPPWVTKWWDIANERRFRLIKKQHEGGGLTPAQEKELRMLQSVCDAIMHFGAAPMKSFAEIDKILEKYPELRHPNPEAESLGRQARLDGHEISTNPFAKETWLWTSWNGGWNEVDRDPKAPKEALPA